MMTFKNKNFTKRDSECTHVVACQAPSAPGPDWVECDESTLEGMTRLWRQGEAVFFGYM